MDREIVALPRRDTFENWNRINPILKNKELVKVFLSKSEARWKLGDGQSRFSELEFLPNNELYINLDDEYCRLGNLKMNLRAEL